MRTLIALLCLATCSCSSLMRATYDTYYEVSWPDKSQGEALWARALDPAEPKAGKLVCIDFKLVLEHLDKIKAEQSATPTVEL